MVGMNGNCFFTSRVSLKFSLDKICYNSYNSAHFLIALNKTYLMSS